MAYPDLPDLRPLAETLRDHALDQSERGAEDIEIVYNTARQALSKAIEQMQQLPIDPEKAAREPNDLDAIRRLRPDGPRRMIAAGQLDRAELRERLSGALLARMAGCTLGAPVEFWFIDRMKSLARQTGQPFPPVDYWTDIPEPEALRYKVSPNAAYTREGMDGVPVDDDVTYTLLGLLIAEDHGLDFTTDDVGVAWQKYLPYACTAEAVALDNLSKGVPAIKAAERDNPSQQWIGAAIRADPWGYIAAAWPEKAAELAYRDAILSHRRNGVYAAIFFAAAIAAALVVDDPMQAIEIGLTEIPIDCDLTVAVRWALEIAPSLSDYQQAKDAMLQRFDGMHCVHAISNACLVVWGLSIGGCDITRVLGETVAMGHDNDCNAATAGSIVGAVVGERQIPRHWIRPFHNTVHTYMKQARKFEIDDVIDRFCRLSRRLHEQA